LSWEFVTRTNKGMNNFNKVLVAVRQYGSNPDIQTTSDCFSYIASSTNIPPDRLFLYLEALQTLGLIEYSLENKSVHLTPVGIKKDTLFT